MKNKTINEFGGKSELPHFGAEWRKRGDICNDGGDA